MHVQFMCNSTYSVRSYQFVLGAGTYGGPMGTVGWLHFYLGQKRNETFTFARCGRTTPRWQRSTPPGLIATSQLSNPRTQQVAPRARIA